MKEDDLYNGEVEGLAAASFRLAKDKKKQPLQPKDGVFSQGTGLAGYSGRVKKP